MQAVYLVIKFPTLSLDFLFKLFFFCSTGLASHLRAVYLFAESITSETKFWAIKTNYTAIENHQPIKGPFVVKMGDDPSNQHDIPAGIYYFETNSNSPYAKGN